MYKDDVKLVENVTVDAGQIVEPDGEAIGTAKAVALAVKAVWTGGDIVVALGGYDGEEWDNVPFEELWFEGDGSLCKQTQIVDVSAVKAVKVLWIENLDLSQDAEVQYVRGTVEVAYVRR